MELPTSSYLAKLTGLPVGDAFIEVGKLSFTIGVSVNF